MKKPDCSDCKKEIKGTMYSVIGKGWWRCDTCNDKARKQ